MNTYEQYYNKLLFDKDTGKIVITYIPFYARINR